MICPVLSKYLNEFILNTKVVQIVSTSTVTPSTRLSDVHDTSGMIPSPSGPSVDNHPKPVFHPRMNSRSEPNTLYCVRTPLTLRLPCIVFVLLLLLCIYCFFPLSYCLVVLMTAADAPVIDCYVDDHTPPASF